MKKKRLQGVPEEKTTRLRGKSDAKERTKFQTLHSATEREPGKKEKKDELEPDK